MLDLLALANFACFSVAGSVSLIGIWTLDSRGMVNYLNIGVRAIVSNRPGVLARVVKERVPKLTLAGPEDSPPPRMQ